MKIFTGVSALITFVVFLLAVGFTNSFAQTLVVEQVVPTTNWVKTLNNGYIAHFPTAAQQAPTLTYTLRNTGSATLSISNYFFNGNHPDHFTFIGVLQQILAPGEATGFAIQYNPPSQFSQQSSAALVFNSNSTGNPTYTIELRGAGADFYGPFFPPYDGVEYAFTNDCPQGNNCIGRAEGTAITFTLVGQADRTDTYRGTVVNPDGDVWIRVSTNGNSFADAENMTFSPAESNLAQGILVHRGTSVINTASGDIPVYLKYIETITHGDTGAPFALIPSTQVGLSEELGGVAKIDYSTQVLRSHSIILASNAVNGTFTPFLDYFESVPEKTCPNCAHYSINKAFYWKNLTPRVLTNTPLFAVLNQSTTITPDILNAYDDEDSPLWSDFIVFDFNGISPLPQASGILRLYGAVLDANAIFTQADIDVAALTYENTNPNLAADSFTFRVKDSKGAFAAVDGSTEFTFNIIIDESISINQNNVPDNIHFSVHTLPNNTQATVKFTFPTSGTATLDLFSMTGSKIAQLYKGAAQAQTPYEIPFTLTDLPHGIYLILLTTDKGLTKTLKLNVNK